jgi:hypothetical protein
MTVMRFDWTQRVVAVLVGLLGTMAVSPTVAGAGRTVSLHFGQVASIRGFNWDCQSVGDPGQTPNVQCWSFGGPTFFVGAGAARGVLALGNEKPEVKPVTMRDKGVLVFEYLFLTTPLPHGQSYTPPASDVVVGAGDVLVFKGVSGWRCESAPRGESFVCRNPGAPVLLVRRQSLTVDSAHPAAIHRIPQALEYVWRS